MRGIVQDSHVPVNPAEERGQVNANVLGQESEGGDRRKDSTTFDRGHERSTEWATHRCLTEPAGDPEPPDFRANRLGKAEPSHHAGLFRNS
jgi:hypothetical protein